MKSSIDWQWSEDTLKELISQIIERKAEYEKEMETDFDKGVIAGYGYVLDSIKNFLDVRGYDFKDFKQ